MREVVLVSLGGGGCPGCTLSCAGPAADRPCADGPVDAFLAAATAEGATVDRVTAGSDAELDAVLARLDGPARDDGLAWPDPDGPRLVVAADSDGQLRHVVRRLVRRYAPPPSRRPADLPAGRTVPDLPALAVLPTAPGGLAARLGLPRDPAEVAKAALYGSVQRLDLLRNDGGSVTIHGVLIVDSVPWSAGIEVDDVPLASPDEPVLACAIANADGYATVDGLPLAPGADPTDGRVTVAVAVGIVSRALLRAPKVRVEVRRVRGRAVAVTPAGELPVLDDGVSTPLARKRSWWTEAGAWGVFRP